MGTGYGQNETGDSGKDVTVIGIGLWFKGASTAGVILRPIEGNNV